MRALKDLEPVDPPPRSGIFRQGTSPQILPRSLSVARQTAQMCSCGDALASGLVRDHQIDLLAHYASVTGAARVPAAFSIGLRRQHHAGGEAASTWQSDRHHAGRKSTVFAFIFSAEIAEHCSCKRLNVVGCADLETWKTCGFFLGLPTQE